jgi:hypothetical protein
MKRFGLVLAVLSFNTFAGNPQLEEIIKKYESSLSKVEVGMTSDEISTGTQIIFSNSDVKVEEDNSDTLSVILKKVGTSAYVYSQRRNLKTGEVITSVELEDFSLNADDVSADTVFTVKDDIVSSTTKDEIEEELGTFSYVSKSSKDLKSSIFCNSKNEYNDTFTFKSSSKVLKAKSTTVNQCGRNMTKEELKAIDLKDVNFCLRNENGESNCEKRDMSFLTAHL